MDSAMIIASIPSLIVAIVAYRLNKKGDERYEEQKKQHQERVKAEKLSMEMQLATAELAYATAMAIKRGKANGEVEAGIESYNKARKDYFDFINNRYVEEITK